jgi:rhodanese-related sulfurtransferase
MRKLSVYIAFLLILCSSCSSNTTTWQTISSEQAKTILDGSNNYILLDVRSEEEYNEQRIDGAILIPDSELESRAEAELPDKTATILVYCRSGKRSAKSADILANLGYKNVYDIGGILDWKYDTVSGAVSLTIPNPCNG